MSDTPAIIETLRRGAHPHVFVSVDGGSEPAYQRFMGRDGQFEYWHETGYGYLAAENVRIVSGEQP